MLFTSVAQHAAPCYQSNNLRLVGNSIWLQHRRCAMVQPCSHKPVQVLAAEKQASTSAAGATSKSSSNTNSSNTYPYPFYNRERELKLLAEYCSTQPRAICVILGTWNGGKTALLQEYMRNTGVGDSMCYIDSRYTPISTPSCLVRVMLDSYVLKLADNIYPGVRGLEAQRHIAMQLEAALGGVQLPGGNEITAKVIEPILKAFAGIEKQEPKLQTVIAAFAALLDAYQARADGQLNDASPPVFILDEADALMRWGDKYQAERQELLSFFAAITKVQRRSHVVLVTSKSSFQEWLTKEIGLGFHNTFVIGDFPAKEARDYLDKCLQQNGHPEVSDADWKVVFKACGGNAGSLMQAAGFYRLYGGWKPALIQITKDMFLSMKPGYLPSADAGYTATDYATAVKAILESPYRAVHDQQLIAELGKQALDAMVQANLLALRPYSSWATDIDDAAFGPDRSFTVVTALTAMQLYLMERHRDMLLKPLDNKKVPAHANTDSSVPRSKSSSRLNRILTSDAYRAVNDDKKAVEVKIEDVGRQMQEIRNRISDIRKAKIEGWQEELAYWRQKDQQLAEKRRQLYEENLQLLEKELLLLKRNE